MTVRVDASSRMGGGHVMRCLTLANALTVRGASVTFVAAAMLPRLAQQIGAAGHALIVIDADPDLLLDQDDWDSRILSDDAQRRDAAATRAAAGPVDWTIVDHYRLDATWEAAEAHGRVLVIDDLANRPHRCDILVDQTFGRDARDYATYVPQDCILLTGTLYAMLRPEFTAARPAALERRRTCVHVPRILVSLGSTDIGGITEQVIAAIDSAASRCPIDVILSADAPSLPALRRRAQSDPRIRLHVDDGMMHDLIAAADLAIGAAGTTSWERCCLGLPTVVLAIAQNQLFLATQLASVDAAIIAESSDEAAATVATLIAEPARLAPMSAAAAALVDGGGTERVAAAVCDVCSSSDPLNVRDATVEDCESLWLWRNDPEVRANSKTSMPIAWPDHARWYAAMLARDSTETLIVERDRAAVGMVRFDATDDGAVISINIAPQSRGRGIGSAALRAACDLYFARHPGTVLLADVHEKNVASLRIFGANDFTRAGAPDGAFHHLRLER